MADLNMKKILFIPPEPWYVERHIEYLIRYLGHKYVMKQGYVKNDTNNPLHYNPDDFDLFVPLLATHCHVDRVKYAGKIAVILWEPNEGVYRESVLAAATTPMAVKSMINDKHPYMDVHPGIDTVMFQPLPQVREDSLFHVGVIGCGHNPRHNVKNIILPLLDIPGVKFDFYVRNFFADRKNDIEVAGGQKFIDNIVDGNKTWPGVANCYNRMDVLLKVDADPGLTFPVLEAMACGIPFIATDVGIEHLFEDSGFVIKPQETDLNGNGRGWFLAHEDEVVKQARSAIIELRDNSEKRMQMGKNGRQMILEKWTWEKVIPKWDLFFELALERAI